MKWEISLQAQDTTILCFISVQNEDIPNFPKLFLTMVRYPIHIVFSSSKIKKYIWSSKLHHLKKVVELSWEQFPSQCAFNCTCLLIFLEYMEGYICLIKTYSNWEYYVLALVFRILFQVPWGSLLDFLSFVSLRKKSKNYWLRGNIWWIGADVHQVDDFMNTPLFYAAENGDEIIVRFLLDKGILLTHIVRGIRPILVLLANKSLW